MDTPVFFADVFARCARGRAENIGRTLAAIYSSGTCTDWDFPHSETAAVARMACRASNGQQVVVFKRAPNGVWSMWANANLPQRGEYHAGLRMWTSPIEPVVQPVHRTQTGSLPPGPDQSNSAPGRADQENGHV